MEVKVSEDRCIGCGQCCYTCEEVFEFNDEKGMAQVKDNADFESNKDDIEEAKDGCPTEAIEVKQ